MLQISIELLQTPVLLSPSCSNISVCQMIPLVGHVTVRNSMARDIGGIRVIWESKVQRQRRDKNGKYSWSRGDVFDQFELDVLKGPIMLPVGESIFEFVIEVPLSLVPTRTTHFDKVTHNLHAAILDASPCYDHMNRIGPSRSNFISLLGRLRPKGPPSTIFGSTPTLAQAVSPVNVFSSGMEEDSTAYNWRHQSEMGGLGHLAVTLDSQLFTLGQSADISLDLTSLSDSTTIHAITVNFVQTTTRALCPSKFSALQGSASGDSEERTELIDKYELYSYGTSWARMPGRMRPFRGSYIWRGHRAEKYVTDFMGKEDLWVDQSHQDGFGLSTTFSLPSPIIGAHPTSLDYDPAFSTISHHLEIVFEYSILDQDIHGDSSLNTGTEPIEGLVRTWTLEKSLQIHSDLFSVNATAAPPYSCTSAPSGYCHPGFDPSMVLESTKPHRSISLGWTKATLMRPVRIDRDELQKLSQRHWEEMAGMCACFEDQRVRDAAIPINRFSSQNERCHRAEKGR